MALRAADDAVALMLAGQLDQQIAICTAEQMNGDTPAQEHAATQLCFLYRACGQYNQAMKICPFVAGSVAYFSGVAGHGRLVGGRPKEPDDRWRDPVAAASYHSAFQRLAGHQPAGAAIMSAVSGAASSDPDQTFTPSRFFLLNDLPGRGMELLVDQHPAVVFGMRVERGEVAEARFRSRRNIRSIRRRGTRLRACMKTCAGAWASCRHPPASRCRSSRALTAEDRTWQKAVTDLDQKNFAAAAEGFASLWAIDRDACRSAVSGRVLPAAGGAG